MRKVTLICVSLVGIFFYQSCNSPKKEISPNADYGKYISAFTSGTVSVESPIIIKLLNQVESNIIPGKEVEQNLFSFEPSIKGKTVWIDKTTIEFIPDELMKGGTVYQAKFKLDEIVDVDKRYNIFSFSFSTIKQSFGITSDGLKTYQGNDFGYMFYKGYVLTADVINPEKIRSIISGKFENNNVVFSWIQNEDSRKHYFRIDSLKRNESEAKKLLIEWNGKSIGIDKKGNDEFVVPALNDFKVLEVKVERSPQLCVVVNFSDPLNKFQNLNGLVTLEDYKDLKFTIEGNQLKVWPARQVTGQRKLSIYRGIENALNFSLKTTQDFYIVFENLKPQVRLIGKGVIVPQLGQLSMPFEAVSLEAVDVRIIQIYADNMFQFLQENKPNGNNELKKVGRLVYSGKMELNPDNPGKRYKWGTYKVNIGDYVKLEQGAFYRVEIRFKKAYSLYGDKPEVIEKKVVDSELEEQLAFRKEQESWDRPGWYDNYYYPPNYNWKDRDNANTESYFNYSRFISRNIFGSNLGIIAKEGEGNNLVFVVTNLNTVEPEQSVNLSVYDFQDRLLATVVTDAKGMAKIKLDKKPFLLIAEKDGQTGYLQLDDGSALSMSNFNVSGQVVQEGLKGFIYGERGVWRPGDIIYLNFILEDKLKQLPEGHPVIFKLVNPMGQVIERRVATFGENGFYHFAVKTSEEAPTGNWSASIQVGGTYFSKQIKVETVKPNRLKINFKLPEVININAVNSIPLQCNWLHGAPARTLKTIVDLNLVRKNTSFKGFEKYSFNDPASNFYPLQQEFFKGTLNEQGFVSVPVTLQDIVAPGMLRAYFTTRVFEQGGDFSINVQSSDLSPYENYLGIKMPSSDDNWYKTDKEYFPEIVVVDMFGNPTSVENVEVELYKVGWRWWWESGNDRLAHYVNGRYEKPVKKWKLAHVQKNAQIKLNVKYRNWDDNGRYLLRVKNTKTGQAAGLTFYMSRWGGWRADGDANGATMLSIRTDKEKYNVGEKIKVTIPSSKNGRALVSLEGGDGVKDIFWVETSDKESSFDVEVRAEMAPNIFIYVSLIQPYGQTENDAPLRLYGVVPVFVENAETILNPVISMNDELEPGQDYEVEVSEKNGSEMTYTLAIVDEGLLGLTNFKTPNPHHEFYAREALGVKTWDMFDYVAGAYGASLEKAFAVGGDENLNEEGKKKVNRFKPVVQFAGPFTLKKGEVKRHQFKMPNYIGAVKAMVVAGNKGAYGNFEKSVLVRKGLMLLATLPRVLGPGEMVSLPVNVFAMKENVKKVSLSIKASDIFEVQGAETHSIVFDDLGDQMVFFKLKVKETVGSGKITIIAKSGNEQALQEIEIEIRNPNPAKTVEESMVIESGSEWETGLKAPGMEGTNKMWLEISGIPSLNISRHIDNLIRYPHGCIEQTVSSAFPQLFLDKLTGLNADEKLETEDNIRFALQRLMAFQLSDGGFSYWPGGYEANDWGTSYAGHFMIIAEQGGFSLPIGLKSKWIRYQKNKARNWNRKAGYRDGKFYNGFELEQAYRLYTLALAGSPDLGAMNRFMEVCTTNNSKWRLAVAYLLVGQNNVASEIINGLPQKVEEYTEFGGTFGSELRDQAMILESLVLQNDTKNAFLVLKDISDELNSRHWLSTQTAAWCFYAASQFINGLELKPELNIRAEINGKKENFTTSIPFIRFPVDLENKSATVKVKNMGGQVVFARLVAKGTPLKGDSIELSGHLNMEVWYTDKVGNGIDAGKLYQGDDFIMNVKLIHPGIRSNYEEMALTAIFPSGWKILNQRLNDVPNGDEYSFDYQDIRDDRIYTYFDLSRKGARNYKFQLNAAYEGTFYLPSVSCGAMYDNTVYAAKPGKWVQVRKR